MIKILFRCLFVLLIMATMSFILNPGTWYEGFGKDKKPTPLDLKLEAAKENISSHQLLDANNTKVQNFAENTMALYELGKKQKNKAKKKVRKFLLGNEEKIDLEELVRWKLRNTNPQKARELIEDLEVPEYVKEQLREIADAYDYGRSNIQVVEGSLDSLQ